MTALAFGILALFMVLSAAGLSRQLKQASLASGKRLGALEAAATKEMCEPLAGMSLAEITERMKAIEPKPTDEPEEAKVEDHRIKRPEEPKAIHISQDANGPSNLTRELRDLSGSEFYLLKATVKSVSRERSAKS